MNGPTGCPIPSGWDSIPEGLRDSLLCLNQDAILAVHDLMHKLMVERYGMKKR